MENRFFLIGDAILCCYGKVCKNDSIYASYNLIQNSCSSDIHLYRIRNMLGLRYSSAKIGTQACIEVSIKTPYYAKVLKELTK